MIVFKRRVLFMLAVYQVLEVMRKMEEDTVT